MKCPSGNGVAALIQGQAGACEHFLGRPSGKCKEEYLFGIHTLLYEVRHAVYEDTRLSAACPGYDKVGPFRRLTSCLQDSDR